MSHISVEALTFEQEKAERSLGHVVIRNQVNRWLSIEEQEKEKLINWVESARDRLFHLNELVNNPEEGDFGEEYDDVFALLAPGRQEDESDEKFLERQEDIMSFYERLLQDVAKNGVDIRGVMRAKREQILDAVKSISAPSTVVLGHEGENFSLSEVEDDQGKIFARDLLMQYFEIEEDQSILDLNFEQANRWLINVRREINKLQKDLDKRRQNDALDRAQIVAAEYVQAYFDEIASYIDESKLREYAEAVQFFMLFKDGDLSQMRSIPAVFKFGDVGAGKGTFEKLTNTQNQTFVTGTGGISKPEPNGPYSHLQRLVSGVMPAVNNGGFNPLMDLFALPQILVFRKALDETGLGDAPMIFDGYPRSEYQAGMIMSKLAEFFPDRLRVFYMSIDEQTALTRILSRIFRGLLSSNLIREDDLAELQFQERDNPSDILNKLLEAVKERLISAGIEIDEGGNWLMNPKFKEVVNELCSNAQDGEEQRYGVISLNPNGRWARYHKKFPEILKMLREKYPNLNTPQVDVSRLTPYEVVFAVAREIGIEATTTDPDIQDRIATYF